MTLYLKNYTNEMKEIILNIKLTGEQAVKLNECMLKIRPTSPYYNSFEDMYKLYVSDISVTDIANAVGRNERTIQLIFKNFGMARDLFKAQSIAVKKRNYNEIRKTYKKTMKKRLTSNQLTGSAIENLIRYDINIRLKEALPHIFIVVGINTMTDVGELDIPIVISKDNILFKFGIEVDGVLFHQDLEKANKDIEKIKRLEEIGYIKIFRISTKAYLTKGEEPKIKYKNQIEPKLCAICDEIVKHINK